MISAFVLGMVTGAAVVALAVIVAVGSVALGGRSSARHWEQVQQLIYGNEGGDE